MKHPLGGSQGAFFVKGLVPVGGTAGFLAGWCSPKSGGAALQGLPPREGTFPPGGRHGAGGLAAACCFLGKMFWIFKRFLQFVPCNFPPILLHF